jgi:hypothetical protein
MKSSSKQGEEIIPMQKWRNQFRVVAADGIKKEGFVTTSKQGGSSRLSVIFVSDSRHRTERIDLISKSFRWSTLDPLSLQHAWTPPLHSNAYAAFAG